MLERTDIGKIMVIGSGPIIISQAAEFDYAGTQACLTLKEEGYEVALANFNPAAIVTNKEVVDQVYIELITLEFVSRILRKEHPDVLLPTLGGQAGLNMAMELAASSILEELDIEPLGTRLSAIGQAENRDLFKQLMKKLNQPVPESEAVNTVEEAVAFASKIGYPVIVRPALTLGGTDGGMYENEEESQIVSENELSFSPTTQCLIEQNIAGFKEIEYEMMRDSANNTIIVCSMGNFDPVNIHTSDSIVFAPSQALSDHEYQMLRDASLSIIRALKIEGGCSIQLALDPHSFDYYVIKVSPCVSCSSTLASKAVGYPIAKLAVKITLGLTLDGIKNPIIEATFAELEPALDYIMAEIPRWPFDKFESGERLLGTQTKAAGEVMTIGRSIEESLLKAMRSLEIGTHHIKLPELADITDDDLVQRVVRAQDDRLFYVAGATRRGHTIEESVDLTKVDLLFLDKLLHIVEIEQQLKRQPLDDRILKTAKRNGFTNKEVAELWEINEEAVRQMRKEDDLIPVYKMVDTCAAEFGSKTPYFYSSYEYENESSQPEKPSVLILGSGPIRIGQGVEFDCATVHSVKTVQQAEYEAIIIDSNPETVSTDFSTSGKLYFEPLTFGDMMDTIELEQPIEAIVQFSGQTAIDLAEPLTTADVRILGTAVEDLSRAENRDLLKQALKELDIPQPLGDTAAGKEEVVVIVSRIGYPILVHPNYILGGRAMEIVGNQRDLGDYMEHAVKVPPEHPVLVDRYLLGGECEVDAICDGETVLIPGIMEHTKHAGVHSGDSMTVYPPQTLPESVEKTTEGYTIRLALGLDYVGMMNVQFVIRKDEVYVIEVDLRASWTVPFLSKVTGIPVAQIVTKAILGEKLKALGRENGLYEETKEVHAKAPAFSSAKLQKVDTYLGPEVESTGEVIGSDRQLDKALCKASEAPGLHLSEYGTALFTIADEAKEEVLELAKRSTEIDYSPIGTKHTAAYFEKHGLVAETIAKISEEAAEKDVVDLIRDGKTRVVVNTIDKDRGNASKNGFIIRKEAVRHGIPLFTSLNTADAIVRVMESRVFSVNPT